MLRRHSSSQGLSALIFNFHRRMVCQRSVTKIFFIQIMHSKVEISTLDSYFSFISQLCTAAVVFFRECRIYCQPMLTPARFVLFSCTILFNMVQPCQLTILSVLQASISKMYFCIASVDYFLTFVTFLCVTCLDTIQICNDVQL